MERRREEEVTIISQILIRTDLQLSIQRQCVVFRYPFILLGSEELFIYLRRTGESRREARTELERNTQLRCGR